MVSPQGRIVKGGMGGRRDRCRGIYSTFHFEETVVKWLCMYLEGGGGAVVILGIDPGVATIGFGVIQAQRGSNRLIRYGVITTPPGIPLSSRLLQISDDMEQLIRTFSPDEMAVEELFFTKNITTGIAVAHGRGVILLAAERLGVPIFEYTPMQVKQAVVGYGGAEKRQVMLMTQRLLQMKEIPRPDDAADALAIAICHSRSATSLLNTERVFDPKKYDTR